MEAYNHDRGEYIELSVKEVKPRVSVPDKTRFYWIEIEGDYKVHERELNDTLGLKLSKEGLAKHLNKE